MIFGRGVAINPMLFGKRVIAAILIQGFAADLGA